MLIGFMILVLQVVPTTAKDHVLDTADFGLPCLWRKIKVPKSLLADKGFAGDIRIGDIDGDGKVEFVLFRSTDGRMKPCFIGAFNSNGQELWRHGAGGGQPQRPGPVTVYDFDGDGRAQILCFFINPDVKAPANGMGNVVIQIRDGLTGKVIRQAAPASMRQCAGEGANWVHQRLLIANFRGTKRPQDFVVKLGSKVLAFNKDLDLLWIYQIRWNEYGRCSAYIPAVGDIDGDKQDEVNGGFYILDGNGQPLWEGQIAEHMDSVAIVPWVDGKMRAICSGYGHVLDSKGKVILRLGKELVPHGQEVRVADFDKSLSGPEMIIRYNGHNPDVMVVANTGKVIRRFELNYSPNHTGMEAVWWNGKAREALLYNGGVLWRANGRKFADLPNLPKPIGPAKMGWYHCIAANVCGDEREEVVLYNPWDKYVWIFSPEPLRLAVLANTIQDLWIESWFCVGCFQRTLYT
ncbi:MAG: rhamnogalacturonan lyase family protein [Planctomycetota bacterium]